MVKRKQKPMMLGFNQAGMKRGAKILIKIFKFFLYSFLSIIAFAIVMSILL